MAQVRVRGITPEEQPRGIDLITTRLDLKNATPKRSSRRLLPSGHQESEDDQGRRERRAIVRRTVRLWNRPAGTGLLRDIP